MKTNVTIVLVVLGAVVPTTALAQAASPETQLQQEMRHRRVIVRPAVPAEQVEHDADRAAEEIRQQGEDATVRELTRPTQRPPQTDPDLKGGIQTRSLNNAVRR